MRINLIILYILICLSSGCINPSKNNPPPNILWIVSEDNSPFLGCYGDELAHTPNLDKLAGEGILFTHAYANAPVCAPARSTLITGMYPPAMGTENMRSSYTCPDFIKFYPYYLKQAGYYTTNNSKKDYNTLDQPGAWDESSREATYINRSPDQPFFHIINLGISHESSLHKGFGPKFTNPDEVTLPAYHPDNPTMRDDWAVYYDRIRLLDEKVGEILQELETEGLDENTIVFYYSDHGGVVARSKRFLFESGLHVPLIIRIPKKYKHLAPTEYGTRSDRMVSFIDFAPTLLNLAGIEIPDYMQGTPFLGQDIPDPVPYIFAFRGRMDERIDLSRSVTDGKYRYTRNYMPHRPYGQHLATLWKAPSMKAWEDEYKTGKLTDEQAAFFLPKPYEELFEIETDPDNVKNLAMDEAYRQVKEELGAALDRWQIEQLDAGLIPEPMLEKLNEETTIYIHTHQQEFHVEQVLEAAKISARGDPDNLPDLLRFLENADPVIRYWGATGLLILGKQALPAKKELYNALDDPEASVGVVAAETLYHLNHRDGLIEFMDNAVQSEYLMTRVFALNALDNMPDVSEAMKPRLKEMLRDKSDRSYDNRLMWKIAMNEDI